MSKWTHGALVLVAVCALVLPFGRAAHAARAADATPVWMACMIDAPSGVASVGEVQPIGHVGWAYTTDGTGDWTFGATEANGSPTTKRGKNNHTWHETGSWDDVVSTFEAGGPYQQAGFYTQYRCRGFTTGNVFAAAQAYRRGKNSGYNVATNNCLTKAVAILKAYGASDLSDPWPLTFPNVYFSDNLSGFGETEQLGVWSVSLSIDASDVSAGTTVNLSADAGQDVDSTPYSIVIVDTSSDETLNTCGSGSTCTAQVSSDSAATGTYMAEVVDGSGNMAAQSASQQVTWEDNPSSGGDGDTAGGWSVTLTADQTDVQAGATVNLTAQASQDVGPTPYSIAIVDQGNGNTIASCGSGSSCAGTDSYTSADSETYVAEIVDESGNVVAQSDPLQVTWEGGPSDDTGGTRTNLGGLDLDSYCQSLGDQGVSLDGSTAYDWHCVDADGNHLGIDMDAACQWQYSDSSAAAVMGDVNDPDSWSCQDGS